MKTAMTSLLALALVLVAATSASAQAAGNWQNVHGQVQAVQGNQLTLKADDGRTLNVDMKQVSPSVQSAMQPNLGVTVSGFPGASRDRFTARYIVQDNAGAAASVATAPDPGAVTPRILPLVPQFLESKEFKDRSADFHNNERAARVFVNRLYRGFLDREPNDEERAYWSRRLIQSGDVRGTVEAFLMSPEYAGKNKNDREAITDLYQAFFGRTPSAEEVQVWEQRIARR
jgi:Domain of unknown function (DUF4214)